jgi:hypothetical protein
MNGGAPFGGNLTKWMRSSVGFSLDRIQTPLLISIFEKGELLPEWETYSGLRQLHRPVEMLWWWKENAPHILVQPVQRYVSQQSAVDWFDFWLNDREDIDPAKAREYIRWRALRKTYQENLESDAYRTRKEAAYGDLSLRRNGMVLLEAQPLPAARAAGRSVGDARVLSR